MTPRPIATILNSSITWLLCRLFMTFMFWWEGLSFLRNFGASVPIMNVLGWHPDWLVPAVTLVMLLGGSVLVIANRFLWLGAGALAVFTALTIPLVHHFWTMTGDAAVQNWREAEEHVAVIGGLASLAVVSHLRDQIRARG